jgi:integrase
MSKKKAANSSGSIEWRKGIAWVRIALPRAPGEQLQRKRLPVVGSDKMTEGQARKAAVKLAADVRAGRVIIDEKPRADSLPSSAALTVRQLASRWTSGALFETYGPVNRLRVKASAYIDRVTLEKHAMGVKTRGPTGPDFGDLGVAAVTTKDVIAVMAAQPKEHRAQTRLHTYQRLRRIFDLAIFPLQLRRDGDNPVSRYLRPAPDVEKEFLYLFPGELLALLACSEEKIRLARRVLYALAVYSGFRRESLFSLTWGDLDVRNRSLVALKTKTGRPCFAEGDPPSLFVLLGAWHAHQGSPDAAAPIIPEAALGCRKHDLATVLRADLKAAGVTRDLLLSDANPGVEPLRFHDLRATFETWAQRAGWPQERIDRRTGHTSEEMRQRYMRAASTIAELRMAVFPDLTSAVPELADEATRLATALAKTTSRAVAESPEEPSPKYATRRECEGGDLNPDALSGASTSS